MSFVHLSDSGSYCFPKDYLQYNDLLLLYVNVILTLCTCPDLKVLAPLPIGFAVFMVHLATIPITGTGINPARSLGAALIYNKAEAWDDQVSIYTFLLTVDICSILSSL